MSYTPSVADLTHPVTGDPAGLACEEIRLLKAYVSTLTGGSLGYKNMIPAGNLTLNPYQRGTTFNAAASAIFPADRFLYVKTGAMVHDITRSTDVPTVAQAGKKLLYSMRLALTTPDNALAVGDQCAIRTGIEGQLALPAYEVACTASFWVKATLPGEYAMHFRTHSGGGYDCVVPFTISAASTWEKKSVSMPATPSAATPGTGETVGLSVGFTLCTGTSFHAAVASTWAASGGAAKLGLATTINGTATGATEFLWTDLVFKPGAAADLQDANTIEEVWQHCFRYYQKSMDVTEIPGSAGFTGRVTGRQYTAAATALESLYSRMMVPMRSLAPNIFWYSPATGAINRVRDVTAGADLTVSSTTNNGRWSAGYPNVTVAPAVGNVLEAGWIADAEITV